MKISCCTRTKVTSCIFKMKTIPVDEEYRKNKDLKPEDVKNLANWVKLQPHLPEMSELEVILFLHSCFYSIEMAKTTIDINYSCRTHFTDFFGQRDPKLPQVIKDMDVVIMQALPEKTPEGYTIIYITIKDPDTSKFNYNNQIRNFTMVVDLLLLQEGTAEGYVLIVDICHLQPYHITKLSPMLIKNFLMYLQEAIPFRLKGIQVFESPSLIHKFMMVIKPFLKKELLDMLHIHSCATIQDMFKYIPKRCLPEDYGGQAPSMKALHDVMKQNIIENRDYFVENDPNKRVDEKLRPAKSKNPVALGGIDGSFKKLEID